MIVNIPTQEDFKKIAIECLHQAYKLISDVDKEIDILSLDSSDFPETSDEEFNENYFSLWYNKQSVLRTSLILIQQSHELFMKAEVAKVSPLLLLENKRTDWPTLYRHSDKDFNTFYSIGAENLLYTYNATLKEPASEDLIKFIEEVRVLRNKITHSIYKELLIPKKILELILNTFTYFLGKDSWWTAVREQLFNNPFFGKIDKKFEVAKLTEVLEDAERYFGRKELSKHFTQNLKNRSYFCPTCKYGLEREDEEIESKWAYLYPNTPSSNIIKCICCLEESQVDREKCTKKNCKGNVFFRGYCLTCLEC